MDPFWRKSGFWAALATTAGGVCVLAGITPETAGIIGTIILAWATFFVNATNRKTVEIPKALASDPMFAARVRDALVQAERDHKAYSGV